MATVHIGKQRLTPRQAEIYAFIVEQWGETMGVPSVREICDEFGIASPNGVVVTLRALEAKGWIIIDREFVKARNIVVPELQLAAKAAADAHLASLQGPVSA